MYRDTKINNQEYTDIYKNQQSPNCRENRYKIWYEDAEWLLASLVSKQPLAVAWASISSSQIFWNAETEQTDPSKLHLQHIFHGAYHAAIQRQCQSPS